LASTPATSASAAASSANARKTTLEQLATPTVRQVTSQGWSDTQVPATPMARISRKLGVGESVGRYVRSTRVGAGLGS